MMFPTIVVDGFLDNPKAAQNLAKESAVITSQQSHPGLRSKNILEIDPALYETVINKIINSHFEGSQDIHYQCEMYFQTTNVSGTGLVHDDEIYDLACIVYLNDPELIECGTSIYKLKENVTTQNVFSEHVAKYQQAIDEKNYELASEVASEYNKLFFDKTIDVSPLYNRALIYDGKHFHAVNKLMEGEDRIVLVAFLKLILPISRHPSNRIYGTGKKYEFENY